MALVSSAVTLHFLVGAVVVANLPALYRKFGLPAVTKAGRRGPGAGRAGLGGGARAVAAVARHAVQRRRLGRDGSGRRQRHHRAVVLHKRPAALAMAYNGASIGGVVFSPLWVLAIGSFGFPMAAAVIGVVMVVDHLAARRPGVLAHAAEHRPGAGRRSDGRAGGQSPRPPHGPAGPPAVARPALLTLAAGMALGLFAQIGLIAHLFSLLVSGFRRAGRRLS